MLAKYFLPILALYTNVVAVSANADTLRAVSALSGQHASSSHWDSDVPASGAAYVEIDVTSNRILDLVIVIEGIAPEQLAPAGPNGMFGAIHIHNYPQGGPNFFIQQLPGEVVRTESGFEFHLDDWFMEDPIVGPSGGAAFVVSEVQSGNAYFGLHTNHTLCRGHTTHGADRSCAAPATAISGHISVIPSVRENLLVMNDG